MVRTADACGGGHIVAVTGQAVGFGLVCWVNPDGRCVHSHDIAPGVKMISGRTDLASISRSTASRLPDSHVLKSVADAAAAGGAAVLVDLGTVRTAAALGWLDIAPAPQRVLVSTNRFPPQLRAHALLDDRQAGPRPKTAAAGRPAGDVMSRLSHHPGTDGDEVAAGGSGGLGNHRMPIRDV